MDLLPICNYFKQVVVKSLLLPSGAGIFTLMLNQSLKDSVHGVGGIVAGKLTNCKS